MKNLFFLARLLYQRYAQLGEDEKAPSWAKELAGKAAERREQGVRAKRAKLEGRLNGEHREPKSRIDGGSAEGDAEEDEVDGVDGVDEEGENEGQGLGDGLDGGHADEDAAGDQEEEDGADDGEAAEETGKTSGLLYIFRQVAYLAKQGAPRLVLRGR